ncbi:MAG TPA: thioesterase family protein, partial [Pseudonocardiaceae bacterium]|nr:thioesterase family protein [Pseudonocardiaceae bacterium]
MVESFYLPLDTDRFRSTGHTAGPWSPDSQHLGPPSALLVRQLELSAPGPDSLLARVTVEVLGPVPVADLTVRSWVIRPGRSVQLCGAELRAGDRPVATAAAWWMTTNDTTDVAAGVADPIPSIDAGQPAGTPEGWRSGYIEAMEWISIKGGLGTAGPATVWARQRVALVEGEVPSGMQRLMAVADSGNGVSNRLDPREWFFINTDLTVHTWRPPVGEWIGLDANTAIGPTGLGVATTTLHDRTGPVGTGNQAL